MELCFTVINCASKAFPVPTLPLNISYCAVLGGNKDRFWLQNFLPFQKYSQKINTKFCKFLLIISDIILYYCTKVN